MTNKPESAAVEAVAWLVTNGGECCEPWLVYERSEVEALPASCIADPLYPQSALDALRGEVERLRADATRYRWLKANCVREWKSDMPHDKGAPSLDIDFEADGHDLDAAIDTALTKVTP